MGRFDEVAGKLVQAQEDITNSLNAKKVGGGSLSKVKISEVAGYIDAIEVGNENDPWIINVTAQGDEFNQQTVKATQGDISVEAVIESEKATLEVPKAGDWKLSTEVEGASTPTVNFEGSKEIELLIDVIFDLEINDVLFQKDSYIEFKNNVKQLKFGFNDIPKVGNYVYKRSVTISKGNRFLFFN